LTSNGWTALPASDGNTVLAIRRSRVYAELTPLDLFPMLYLFLADGTVLELPNASEAKVEGDEIVCFNSQGRVIAHYDKVKVMAYGTSPGLKEYFKTQD